MMEYKEILFEVRDNIAWITINRPEVRNAFREQTLDELIHAFKSTNNDQSLAAAVVTGAAVVAGATVVVLLVVVESTTAVATGAAVSVAI